MIKNLLLTMALSGMGLTGFGQDQNVDSVSVNAFSALKNKNLPALRRWLADSCTMAGLDAKTTRDALPQVVRSFAPFSSFEVESVTPEGSNKRIKVLLHYTQGSTGHPNILLNEQHQIIALNIIRDPKIQRTAGNTLPNQVILPFVQINRHLYVEGTLNGTKGLWMIDNGAFGLIVNRELMGQDKMDTVNYAERLNISGANGRVSQAGAAVISEITFANVKLKSLRLVAMPMEAQVSGTGQPNLGLLGYDFLKNYELFFDLEHQRVELNKVDSLGHGVVSAHAEPLVEVPFIMQRHLPIVTAIIDGQPLRFAIDCGASHNIIYRNFDNYWKSQITGGIEKQPMTGVDNRSFEVMTGNLKKMTLGKVDFKEMLTAFSENRLFSPSSLHTLKIDGILGMPFFLNYQLKINYARRQLTIYPAAIH